MKIIEFVIGHFVQDPHYLFLGEEMTGNICVDAPVTESWVISNSSTAYPFVRSQLSYSLTSIEKSSIAGGLYHYFLICDSEFIAFSTQFGPEFRIQFLLRLGRYRIGVCFLEISGLILRL